MFEARLRRLVETALKSLGLNEPVKKKPEKQPTQNPQQPDEKPWDGRIFSLPQAITHENMESLQREMETSPYYGKRPLLLLCDSNGGLATAAMSFADFIRKSRVPIITYGRREVSSAAVLILSAGARRMLREGTVLGMHGCRLGKNAEYFADDAFLDIMEKKLWGGVPYVDRRVRDGFRVIMEGYARQRLPDRLFGKDMEVVTAQQAIQLGLADRIGNPMTPNGLLEMRKHFKKA